MVEDGSRLGWLLGYIGGFVNLLIMAAILVRIVQVALSSLRSPHPPSYTAYFTLIGIMLYAGIMGVWILSFANRMRYAAGLKAGAKGCLIFGILSLNIFSVIGSIYGYTDYKYLLSKGYVPSKDPFAKDLAINPLFK